MLRKGYVFLLVVFLCKTLTGISCNSSGNVPAGESEQIFPMVQIFFFSFPSFHIFPSIQRLLCRGAENPKPPCVPASCKRYPSLPPHAGSPRQSGDHQQRGPFTPLPAPGSSPGIHAQCPLSPRSWAQSTRGGKGIGSRLWCWKHCRSIAVRSHGI